MKNQELEQLKELMAQSPEGREAIIEIEQLESEGVPPEMILEAFKLLFTEVSKNTPSGSKH